MKSLCEIHIWILYMKSLRVSHHCCIYILGADTHTVTRAARMQYLVLDCGTTLAHSSFHSDKHSWKSRLSARFFYNKSHISSLNNMSKIHPRLKIRYRWNIIVFQGSLQHVRELGGPGELTTCMGAWGARGV